MQFFYMLKETTQKIKTYHVQCTIESHLNSYSTPFGRIVFHRKNVQNLHYCKIDSFPRSV